MRDLVRAREAAVDDLKSKRQQVLSLLLRLGLHYPGANLDQNSHEMAGGAEAGSPRTAHRFRGDAVGGAASRGACDPVGAGDPRGGAGVVAFEGGDGTDGRARPRPHLGSDFMAEIGARQLMAYLGLVPGEESTGDRVWRGGITKAGNHRARRILVECSWSYRHPPRVGKKKLSKFEATLPAVQEIAWKAQARLTARYRALARRGKRPTLVVTAIARELS